MVLTTTSKPTFLLSLFDYFVLLLDLLYDHMIGHSAVVFHVFMFY